MEAIILKTLKQVKSSEGDINRETLDNVDHCIRLLAKDVPEAPKEIKKVEKVEADTKTLPMNTLDVPKSTKRTREDLNQMEYKEILKEYSLKPKQGWAKQKWIEYILEKGI
jgi:hypothetical protein